MSTGFDNTNPTMPRAAEAQPKAAPVAPAAEMSIQDFNRQIRKAGPVAAAAATACGGGGGAGEGASDVDRNKLEAQLMRAEMRGDNEKVSALKAQLASIVTTLGFLPVQTLPCWQRGRSKNTGHDVSMHAEHVLAFQVC